MRSTKESRQEHWLLHLLRGSMILQMLDGLAEKIYRSFGSGFFGWLFTGYRAEPEGLFASLATDSHVGQVCGSVRRFCNRQIEESVVLQGIRHLLRRMLQYRLRTYGFFCMTFGAYTAVFTLIQALLADESVSIWRQTPLAFAIGVICLALPLLLSRATLRETLCSTYAGDAILHVLGYTPEEVCPRGEECAPGRMSVAFFWGILAGVLTLWIEPWWILLAFPAALCLYLILCKPEIGVLALFFAMPLLPTMALAALVIYTFFCFMIKVVRGKRSIRIEPLDILVMSFGLILFCGGMVSLSGGSRKPALLFVCLLLGYFEVVWLLREREWLVRCSVAGVCSATLVSLYGILQYLLGTAEMAEAWVDSEMFSSIGGRAVGTLENPNMLGEYLILMLPLAVWMFVGHGEGLRKLPAAVCIALMGGCLVFTWSRGAWLGMLFGLVLFVFIWHRRAIWLLFVGIASIPFLPTLLPDSIIQRFTSIGNLSDSSTSYRVHIWRATCDMLRDYGFSGIGIGESAWFRVYPKYAYMGVETAPHSHNLFLQIWLETGICGLIVFVLILFLLFQSVFTMCRQIREAAGLATLPLREEDLRDNSGSASNRRIRKTETQLRLACAAPLAGLFAVLVQGMTDYAWYNYRVYLMFWLMVGLTSAFARSGRAMRIEKPENEMDCATVDLSYRASRSRVSRSRSYRGRQRKNMTVTEEETRPVSDRGESKETT